MSAQSITFYRHYICFAENLSVAVVVNANILIMRRFKMGVTEKTVRNRLKEHGGFWVDGGQVGKK